MSRRPASARSVAVSGALLLAVSFALAGCSQGTDAAEEGPITSRMNALYGGTDRWRGYADQYEELVAACMKEKGFEYTPMAMDDDAFSFGSGDEDWDPVAEAKENGYWITPASKDALLEQYGLDEGRVVEEGPFAADDPNAAYRDSLSAGDQAAYDEALMGSMLNDPEADYDWTTAGCAGEASHEVYGAQMEAQEAQQDSTVMDDYSTYVEAKVTDDPRILEATTAWASCMADQGYDFATSEEARTSIQQRYDELTSVDSTGDDWMDQPDPDRISDEEIVALHDDEIATATADAQCTVEADLSGVYEDVYRDAETEFYNTHKTEVDAWFAAQEALLNKER